MITTTLKNEYRSFLNNSLKETYSIEMFEDALLFDINEVAGQQDGPEYTLELSGMYSKSGNPETFSFGSKITEIDEDEWEVKYFWKELNED